LRAGLPAWKRANFTMNLSEKVITIGSRNLSRVEGVRTTNTIDGFYIQRRVELCVNLSLKVNDL